VVLCILAVVLASEAAAGLPKPEDIKALQATLDSARQAITSPNADLDEADRQLLLHELTMAQSALTRFVRMSNEHAQRNGLAPLYAMGGALVADDATGIGAADDFLLPLVGVAILVAHVVMVHRPSTPEVEAAWTEVAARSQQLSAAARKVGQRRKPGCYCRCFKRGEGPTPGERMPNEASCAVYCEKRKYQGYQCGGKVQWN
jgi:hypothetical protein